MSITFKNEADIVWIKHDKEFLYQGKMYDIQHIERSNGVIEVQCVLDIFDTRLLQHHDFIKSQKENRIVRSLQEQLPKTEMYVFDDTVKYKLKPPYLLHYFVRYLDIDRPPP